MTNKDYLASADVWTVLDLIVAEFQSDPMSQACFDQRLVARAIALLANDRPAPVDLDAIRHARDLAAFHCAPGTFDGCQSNDGDVVLCAYCERLAATLLKVLDTMCVHGR